MQAFEIFRTGTHTAVGGQTLPFDREALAAAVAAYDPNTHEAPVVVGHPKDNHPAFGWIDYLELTDAGVVMAHPKQVDADFAELVEQGRYKKRSASWYLPDSPFNPKPGTLYLRHVGFLGAMPPALKGLGDIKFNESEEGVVEFGDTSPYVWSMLGDMFRSLREWFIAEKGIEQADKLLPSYNIDELAAESERLRQARMQDNQPTFSEDENPMPSPTPKVPDTTDFAERELAIAKRERDIAKREIGLKIDDLIKDGKVLPASKQGLVEFMATLEDGTATVEFGEGTSAVKQSPREFMQTFLSSLPKVVDFGEHSKGQGAHSTDDLTAEELAQKAGAYHAKQAAAGTHISFTEAMTVVQSGKDKE